MHLDQHVKNGQNLDTIIIEEISTRAVIGVAEWERKILQDIKISLTLTKDIRSAAISDNIEDAADYSLITRGIMNLVEKSQCHLIEKLASEVAKYILTTFAVQSVKVRLEKPGALRHTKTVGVEIHRTRADFPL